MLTGKSLFFCIGVIIKLQLYKCNSSSTVFLFFDVTPDTIVSPISALKIPNIKEKEKKN